MLTKTPKSVFKQFLNTSLKTVFVIEGAAFVVTFGVWYKLNTDREFRLYMYKNHNWVLESYYQLGERVADQKTRQLDQKVWDSEGRLTTTTQ